MAEQRLSGKRIAILATDGYEQSELTEPKRMLEEAGARTTVIAPAGQSSIKGWNKSDWGSAIEVDLGVDRADPADFDALLLPGGVMNPDTLRLDRAAVEFVQAFAAAEKPMAVICHAPIMLIEAGLARGRQLTSWPSIRTDLVNAGANWQDQAAVVDGTLVTSRKPDDIPQFVAAFMGVLS